MRDGWHASAQWSTITIGLSNGGGGLKVHPPPNNNGAHDAYTLLFKG